MRYRLKKGMVLFSVCGEFFLFPSREVGTLPPVILSVSEELAHTLDPTATFSLEGLSRETEARLKRWLSAGIIEEYQE